MRLIDWDTLIKEAGKLWSEMPDGEELSKELMKAINHAPTVGGWISVKDRLPETGRLALVYGSAGAMTIARYIANNEWLVPGIFSTVTHWMPLPTPPGGES